MGAYGKIPQHGAIPLWRRLAVAALGFFYIYIGLMYYLPKYRRQREELNQLLDETEREIDEREQRLRMPK